MGNYTILQMFENPRRGRQARNLTTNVPKILVPKSSSEQIFSRKLPLGAPGRSRKGSDMTSNKSFDSSAKVIPSLSWHNLAKIAAEEQNGPSLWELA